MDDLSAYTGKVKPETVTVGGVVLSLGEFDMRTRAAWLDVSKEYDLERVSNRLQNDVLPGLSALSSKIESDPIMKSLQKRALRFQILHDELVDTLGTPDEPKDFDVKIQDYVARMQDVEAQMIERAQETQAMVYKAAQDAQVEIGNLMEAQDRARVDFVWRIARVMGKTELDFEEFYSRCGGDDYEAADRFIKEGNARWASLFSSRLKPNQSQAGIQIQTL
jgi:hypothetical protein